jgi:4-alpha-glucanotransferase
MRMMDFGTTRTCGILLHPTSLPGPGGIGTLGAAARAFVDLLRDAGQGVWQILPLGPTGYGDSPYAALSTFAGNPLMIDLEALAADAVVDAGELGAAPPSTERVDFGAVVAFKIPLLERAAARFVARAPAERRRELEAFCESNAWWLEDFALFMAIKKAERGRPTREWDEPLRKRDPAALARAGEQLAVQLHACRVQQFYFFRQWNAVRGYANERGVRVLGDMPIFVALDSSDVWAHPELFKLDAELRPTVVAGVPPDYFSATGQLWGNPLYDWPKHAQSGFGWWLERMRHALSLVDAVRLDHFRGFEAAWEVASGEPTAERGEWVEGPGDAFFDALRARFGRLPLVAEDLGLITEAVHALRDRHGLPGMHVLHFGFSPSGQRVYAPHAAVRNSVVYTGTHDNDTTVGWFRDLPHEERELVKAYLNTEGSAIHWSLVRAAYATSANTAIVPIQDVLGLGSEARMNLPGHMGSSWSFRLAAVPHAAVAARLRELARLYERLPPEAGTG